MLLLSPEQTNGKHMLHTVANLKLFDLAKQNFGSEEIFATRRLPEMEMKGLIGWLPKFAMLKCGHAKKFGICLVGIQK
jgi:hypothetical protein